MKRFCVSLFAAFFVTTALFSQTMNIRQGSVCYSVPASDAGDMNYGGAGTLLTVGNRTYNLSDITRIDIDDTAVSDATVEVVYAGATASVVVSGDIAGAVDVSVSGAHVCVIDNGALSKNITYRLSGSSANGSFYMDGKQQSTFVLDNLTLTCPDSSAVCIQTGKEVEILLPEGSSSSLADGLTSVSDDGSDAHKAPLFINGRSTWTLNGALSLTGNVRHGLCTDAAMTIAGGSGSITVASSVTDGFHTNEFFLMKAGNVSIHSGTDGIDNGVKSSSTDSANGTVTVSGGTLTIVTDGTAAKGLKSEGNILISDGTVSIQTTGDGSYEYVDGVLDLSSAAAIKANAAFTMTGGTVELTSTGAGGKGINATGEVTVSGGSLTVVTTGGVYAYGSDDTKPQAVKSDNNITLAGGTVLVCASGQSGTAFKTDKYVYTNGATVMGIGGKASTPSKTSTCAYKTYSGVGVTGGQTLSYDGVSFTIPAAYSNSSAKVLVSSPSM